MLISIFAEPHCSLFGDPELLGRTGSASQQEASSRLNEVNRGKEATSHSLPGTVHVEPGNQVNLNAHV